MGLELTSTAFREGDTIPFEYTCDGEDVSPPLAWSGVPNGAGSLALLAEDIDSVKGVWAHWIIYDLPTDVKALEEGIPASEMPPVGGIQGRNDFDAIGYGGPCPSDGKEHRYVFRLFALNQRLYLGPGATRDEVLQQMEGRVIDQGDLSASYKRLKDR